MGADCRVTDDFVHELAGVAQRFIGAMAVAEPGVFVSAIHRLLLALPIASNSVELAFTIAFLDSAVMRGAATYHELFHRHHGGGCGFYLRTPPAPCLIDGRLTCDRISGWAEAFQRDFDATHQWPVAVRAAAVFRRYPCSDLAVREVATTAGASWSTLQRSFRRVYGIWPHRYKAIVRLRKLVEALREDATCVEAVVLVNGYRSTSGAYRLFASLTGMTLADVRKLPEDRLDDLMNGPLAIPVPQAPGNSSGGLRPAKQ